MKVSNEGVKFVWSFYINGLKLGGKNNVLI